ncbi:MAG TPA: GIY-YIG nuclease family protein [Allosphingosinicella sp.]|jgi:hypothetical protein
MLEFAHLLELEQLDAGRSLLLRHCPWEPPLRRILPALAEEDPDLFNLYQRSHGRKAEAAVSKAGLIASFIGHEPGRALFVGLYENCGAEPMTPEESRRHPGYQRLVGLGLSQWEEVDPRATALFFDLKPLNVMSRWKGKLVIQWPPPDRSWFRRPNATNRFPVLAIHEESLLIQKMPTWPDLCLSWGDLQALPRSWQAALAQWRGIYYIHDASDGRGYVGSAYGSENILGRWRGYAAVGHGGNALLRKRDPANFTFSILERVSPDMPSESVVHIESRWKTRLHTRVPHGLNAN